MNASAGEHAGVVLVTGISAAGKSTVGELLARRFGRAAFIEGDLMWKLIVAGRDDMSKTPSAEAVRQLHLRYRNAALLADSCAASGFVAVHSDIVMEADLERYPQWVTSRPVRIVVLRPSLDIVIARERGRGTNAYGDWVDQIGSLESAIADLDAALERSPKLGLWIDSSNQTPDQTVDQILARWDDALVAA